MAGPRYVGYKRPKNTKKTILHLLSYLGRHKWMFALVALLVFISAGANLMGTYLLKPMINLYIVPGDLGGLLKGGGHHGSHVLLRGHGHPGLQPADGPHLPAGDPGDPAGSV